MNFHPVYVLWDHFFFFQTLSISMYFGVSWLDPRLVINDTAEEWKEVKTGPKNVRSSFLPSYFDSFEIGMIATFKSNWVPVCQRLWSIANFINIKSEANILSAKKLYSQNVSRKKAAQNIFVQRSLQSLRTYFNLSQACPNLRNANVI